jgi:zinc finger protein ZPR1
MQEKGGASVDEKSSLHRKDGNYELPNITEKIDCPICNKKALGLTRTMYQLPDGDDVLILLLECGECHYKKSDMVSMFSAFQPGTYYLCVDDGDLTHKIFRGATGDLIIDEIGIEIERGPAATFEFTNMEGILLKIKEQLEFFIRTTPKDTIEWKNASKNLEELHGCLDGKKVFNVKLVDKEGGSYIAPSDKSKMEFIPMEKQDK